VERCTGSTFAYLTGLKRYSDWLRAAWSGFGGGVHSLRGRGILFSTASRTALRPTQSPIQWVLVSFFPREKRPGREADQSPPSSAEVKNAWSYTSNSQYVCMARCLVKHRDNFTFYLYLTDLDVCLLKTNLSFQVQTQFWEINHPEKSQKQFFLVGS
jgi:hypothetical protein